MLRLHEHEHCSKELQTQKEKPREHNCGLVSEPWWNCPMSLDTQIPTAKDIVAIAQ